MAYCTNCGQQLRDSAKFCDACGSPVKENKSATHEKREQEYAGKIIKCPACGEELSAFTAVCPSCGHEINSVKISPTLAAFSGKVETYDKEIANNIEKRTGWKTWPQIARILWIIINIVTLGVLAVLVCGFKYIISYSKHPILSAVEKKKTALIENLSVPNEREATLEVLLFIKAKVSFLSSGKNDSRTAYWLRIWGTKAEQLYEKAKLILGEDAIAGQAISYIRQRIDRSRKNVRFKTAVAVTCMLVYSVAVITIHPATQVLVKQAGIDIPAASGYAGSVTETHKIKSYCGKNLAACGTFSSFYKEYQDNYGNGYVKLSIITEEGIYISPDDVDTMEQYIVVQQSIQPETNITFQFAKEKGGNYGRATQMYRSFDEIVLFVKPLTANTSKFDGGISFVPITESPDKNTYFVRDYLGRNLASCGAYSSFYGDLRDDYGAGQITLNIVCDDGTYIHPDRIEQLQEYIITGQGTPPNTEVQFTFDEYVPSLWSFTGSSLSSIDVYVTRLDERVIFDAYQTAYSDAAYVETNEENNQNATPCPAPSKQPSPEATNNKNYIWPTSGLSAYLPVPQNERGEIIEDDESCFRIVLHKATSEEFQNYIASCKEKGFTVDSTKDSTLYEAYNAEGCRIHLHLNETDDKLQITVYDPVKRNQLNWSVVPMMENVPTPPSNIGEVGNNFDWTFSVYILDVTYEEYSAYVDKCIKKGFKNDFSRYDNWFSGEDKDGYDLRISWEGNSTMHIDVTNLELF